MCQVIKLMQFRINTRVWTLSASSIHWIRLTTNSSKTEEVIPTTDNFTNNQMTKKTLISVMWMLGAQSKAISQALTTTHSYLSQVKEIKLIWEFHHLNLRHKRLETDPNKAVCSILMRTRLLKLMKSHPHKSTAAMSTSLKQTIARPRTKMRGVK